VKKVVPEFAQLMKIDESTSRPQVVKAVYAYVKEHNLQNPSDRRQILLDEPLQGFFKVKKCTCFSINKYLNKVFYEE
jgi:upstream activation factor subunit UAF30